MAAYLEADFRLIGLNVTGVVHLSQLILRDMVSRGEGKVLFTSSIASTISPSSSQTTTSRLCWAW